MPAVSDSAWAGRKLHFIAIGGAGMSGLALVCDRLGARVSGSDRTGGVYLDRLVQAGIDAVVGHDAKAVPQDADVVVSTAISDENVELAIARKRGQRVLHRGELLAEVCGQRRLIAVAGTHGKTTTCGMIAHALRAMGADPTFLIGGELPGAGAGGAPANAGAGAGEWIVAEADESDGSFLGLRPEVAVITNVELDHHSRWSGRAELIAAFGEFGNRSGSLALASDLALAEIAAAGQTLRFGPDAPGPDDLGLGVPGAHNVLNARAALAAIALAGFEVAAAADALRSFPGMVRRQELKGHAHGAAIYDDYAHHPTEVRATLAAMRELGPSRLIAVFQPHLYSRTKALAADFGAALALADEVAVLDVYAAREEPVGQLAGVSGLTIARATAEHAAGRPVLWLGELSSAARKLAPRLREGDLLVTIGAGDVHTLGEELVRG